ncbi:MAG: hypothetical protein RL769_407, partial [Pseudomonadota bacterium]
TELERFLIIITILIYRLNKIKKKLKILKKLFLIYLSSL